MNRRGFIGALVGGVAIAQAVRSWPFRVFSFPSELRVVDPLIGQTVFTTASGNYFQAGDNIWVVHTAQLDAFKELRGRFRVTSVDRLERTMTLDAIREEQVETLWKNLVRHK